MISIIMATFRRQHAIKDTLIYISQQTLQDYELIIVDNEPNHTYNFIDPKIKYYQHSEKISAAYARNKGIEYVIGDLVCFFDDDDIMSSIYLEEMSKPFSDEKVMITHCGVQLSTRGKADWSYGTPSCMVRRILATPTWSGSHHGHDQTYWKEIIEIVGEDKMVRTNKVLVHALTSRLGGLRGGGSF
jgi:glycosyltransferase involved in cell wall biosynthesis